jgi:tetratricopeptide (TPR) repeat protein
MKYQAFISYSHVDRKWARWLHRAIESFRLPSQLRSPDGKALPKRINPVFRDRDELPSAPSLSDAVKEALIQSKRLIVICSPSAATSPWVNEEVRVFRNLGRSADILCFIIDGEPGSGQGNDCFPEALIEPEEPGGPQLEPLAADARRTGDGRRNALVKIVAGMLGVGFDALKQRDLRRRQKRQFVITTGSLAIAALTVLLAINAVIARNEAEKQHAQAEDLINFMLDDLRGQLQKIGRLDVFESVSDKALEYFAAQPYGNASEHTLSQRAKNLRQIGDVRMEQGNSKAALEAFNESLLIMEQLAKSDATNMDAQIGLANSLFYVGYVYLQRGELQEARSIFEQVIPIVDGVAAQEPGKTSWLVERAYAHTNLGRVLELEGAYEEAFAVYHAVMDINQRLVELQPDNPEWQLELGFAHNNLGKLVTALGHLDEAENYFRRDLEIKQQLFESDSSHNINRSYLAVSQYFLGQLLVARGQYVKAESLLVSAQKHFLFLSDVDQERKGWKARRANIERELGILYASDDRKDESLLMLESSINTLEVLSQDEQANTGWRRDLTRSLLVYLDLTPRHDVPDIVVERLQSVNTHVDMLLQQEPTRLETQELSAFSAICTARFMNSDLAKERLQFALKTINQFFPGSTDPRIMELRFTALTGLGRLEEAAILHNRLNSMSYKGRDFGRD